MYPTKITFVSIQRDSIQVEVTFLKKILIGLSSTVSVLVAAYFLVPLIMMNNVKENVLENNSDVEQIITMHHIGSWGEWFSEYVFVVEIDGQKFRIWTTNNGEIIDREALES